MCGCPCSSHEELDVSVELLERKSIVSGIGQSAVGRRLGRGELDLTIEACLQAIADAGLTRDDIDGLSTFPGAGVGGGGFAGPTSPEVQDALRLRLNWHDGGLEGPGQLRAVFAACLAVAAGLARHVLVYRTVTESSAQGSGGRQGIGGAAAGGRVPRLSGVMQWTIPYGAVSAANWLAWVAQRRMFEFGLTREQLAQIALNARKNAGRNPKAIYRDPMSMDDYFAARMITTPLCLFDCDVPCDGSTAVVVSHVDYAPDAPRVACHVNAIGTAVRGRPSWDQFDDMTTMAARDAGASLWERTELTPADVDVAELYDGFSILTMVWLEALGLCGRGESGPFVAGGANISLDGRLPLNTSGGQLSAGRLHGFGMLHEACVQLRGEGGERQVSRPPQVAVVAAGGGPLAGCMLLTRGG
jgi:acetyl-CoA acetyltransferase